MGFYKELAQIFYYVIRSFKMIFKKKNLFFIGIIVFVVLVFGFYNNVFATDDFIDFITIDNLQYVGGSFQYHQLRKTKYFFGSRNFIYTINNNTSDSITFVMRRTNEPPAEGLSANTVVSIAPGDSYTFVGGDYYYCFSMTNNLVNLDDVTGTYTPVNGFDTTTDKLSNEISVNNLWSVFPPLLVGLGVLFALAYVVVKKVLKDDNRVY